MKKKILSFLLSASLLAAAVVPASPVTAQGTNSSTASSAAVDTDSDGLYVGKSAEKIDENEYQITLEAYTNGEVNFEEKAVPTDIVLVLDQSGSMDDYITVGSRDYYTGLWWSSNVTAASYGTVYYLDNGIYREVKVTSEYIFWEALYRYTYEYTDASGQKVVLTSDRFWNAPPEPLDGNLYVKRTTDTNITRLEALKDAVGTFERQVIESTYGPDGIQGTEDDVDHRIAIVGFANEGWSYGNTEIFVGDTTYTYGNSAKSHYKDALQDMTTSDGQDNIGKSIDALDANGATYAQYGMEMANGILNTVEDSNRNKVIILFTDGYPGQNADNYDAETANATIAQADIAKASGALVYSVGIFNGADSSSPGNVNGTPTEQSNYYMQKVSSNNGVPQEPSYYLSASDAGSLNEIFETIGGTISKPTIDLDENTIVKDVVSPYFKVPANETDIHVYTADYNGTTFDDPKSADGVTVNINGDTISVTGFDFNSNFISQSPKQDGSYGKKLIIQFVVTPKEGFLGGNGVPTNGEESGVYIPGMEEAQDYFPQPTVDVPIADINVTAEDKNVYLLDSLSADQLKAGATTNVGNVQLRLDQNDFGLAEWQNAFVNINVMAPSDKTNLTDDTDTYELSVSVTPKTEGTVTGKTGSDSAYIYVFKPVITWRDSQINSGDTPDYKNQNFAGVEWKHGTTVANNMIGEEPELTYVYEPEAGPLTEETPVKVTVKIDDKDISEHVTSVHADDCTFPDCKWEEYDDLNEGYRFIVHIKSFDLTIEKTGCEAIDENQTFIFNVTGPNGYSTQVVIKGNDSVTIKGLPAGTYTITEDTSWSWRYEPEYGDTQTVRADDVKDGAATVTFNNIRNNEQWLDGNAYEWNLFDGSND